MGLVERGLTQADVRRLYHNWHLDSRRDSEGRVSTCWQSPAYTAQLLLCTNNWIFLFLCHSIPFTPTLFHQAFKADMPRWHYTETQLWLFVWMITLCPANTNISRDNYIEWVDKQHGIENRKNTVRPTSDCAHRWKTKGSVNWINWFI